VNKRLWALTRLREYLDQAIRAHQRGFWLRNDHYNGINFAFLLNERAAVQDDPAEAITDFVAARRVRREVIHICDDWLRKNRPPDPAKADAEAVEEFAEQSYWMLATRGEALLGLGQTDAARRQLAEAYASAPRGSWMPESTREQIAKLEKLLETNPLERVK
jgi:tetratricopeptide (TPR) repeat protein